MSANSLCDLSWLSMTLDVYVEPLKVQELQSPGSVSVADVDMASHQVFFAHRLGHRDVDCEKGHGCGSLARKVAGRDCDVRSATAGKCCTDPEGKHTWQRPCHVVSFPHARSMSPPLDQFREPPTLTTHVAPGSLLPRTVPNRTRHQAGPACLTASNSAQRAEDTAPPICKEQQSAHPHCPGYDSRRPAELLNSEPSGRHSLADRASRQTSFCTFQSPNRSATPSRTDVHQQGINR